MRPEATAPCFCAAEQDTQSQAAAGCMCLRKRLRRLAGAAAAVISLLSAAVLLWYFLEVHTWDQEEPVLLSYTSSLVLLNSAFSPELSSRSSPAFRSRARLVQHMVHRAVNASPLAPYFNQSSVIAFGPEHDERQRAVTMETAATVVALFSLLLRVPSSHRSRVGVEMVTQSLTLGLQLYMDHLPQLPHLPHLPLLASLKVTDCDSYTELQSRGPLSLPGPLLHCASCRWRLWGPPGSLLQLHVLRCQGPLLVYDSLMPNEELLIARVSCSSQQQQLIVSSGQTMTVVWERGEPEERGEPGERGEPEEQLFSLSVGLQDSQDCWSTVQLRPVQGVQGSLQTPFFPGHYPPNTSCTWSFHASAPGLGLGLGLGLGPGLGLGLGLRLDFEGYSLSPASPNQTCEEEEWLLQGHRRCGVRRPQVHTERILLLSRTTAVLLSSVQRLTAPGLSLSYSLYDPSQPCPGQFLCVADGQCVTACDGISDCANGLDEKDCECVMQFQCPGPRCVDFSRVCDGHEDCPLGSDESNCTTAVWCSGWTHVCADGACVKKTNPRCDLLQDCADGSDELHCDCGVGASSERIVGGADAAEGAWPWQASLQVKGGHVCGAALVSSVWLLSAAHCFSQPSSRDPRVWTVLLGRAVLDQPSPAEEQLQLQLIVLHPLYQNPLHDYDLALLRLQQPSSGQPVCLPPPTHLLPPRTLCWVTGWGALREGGRTSALLQEVSVLLVSEQVCVRSYGARITPRMICAGYERGGKDACQGDSGGPLVCAEAGGRWFLAGVVSWGQGCARPESYGVYTRVSRLSAWVQTTMET